MAKIETREVQVDGVRSFVREAGSSSAREAVVFVHGNPGSGEDFEALLQRAGDLGRAVAPDMPGYGKADRPDAFDYTVDGYAKHLGGVIDALGIERVHLVLHDFGGPWGLLWASQNTDKVASLTMFNMGALPGYKWHKFARIWRAPILGEVFQAIATRAAFRFMLNNDNPKPFPSAFADRMFADMNGGTKRAMLKLYRATDDFEALGSAVTEKLRPLKLPALILWGTGDAYLPVRYADMQQEFFPGVEVHKLEGCGHWPFIDEPERTAALVMPFLSKQLRV